MSHHYSVVNPKGSYLRDHRPRVSGAACFADYSLYSPPTFGENLFTLYFPTEWRALDGKNGYGYCRPNTEQLKEIAEGFVRSGFPVQSYKEEASWLEIVFNEKDYYNRTHLRILLDFIRCFFEGSNTIFGTRYFQIKEEVRLSFDFLTLLQLICLKFHSDRSKHGGNGHPMPISTCGEHLKFAVITPDVYLPYLKKESKNFNTNVSPTWGTLRTLEFKKYQAKLPELKIKPTIGDKWWKEMLGLSFDSVESINRALRIALPVPKKELVKEEDIITHEEFKLEVDNASSAV